MSSEQGRSVRSTLAREADTGTLVVPVFLLEEFVKHRYPWWHTSLCLMRLVKSWNPALAREVVAAVLKRALWHYAFISITACRVIMDASA